LKSTDTDETTTAPKIAASGIPPETVVPVARRLADPAQPAKTGCTMHDAVSAAGHPSVLTRPVTFASRFRDRLPATSPTRR